MNHSNNYFQKGVIILVATMLLTIPSLRVYSFVGSYQLLSQAINANNYYNIHAEKKGFRNLPAIVAVTLTVGIIVASAVVSAAVSSSIDESYAPFIINLALEPNPLNENYAKHDFSEFDNN